MKNTVSFLLIICISIAFSASICFAEKEEIQWQSYDTGMKMIKDQNKKGFLHFYSDWCKYCKIMNNQTFADSKIIKYLNKNFISIRVNTEKQKNIARKYRVRGLPNTWFLAEDTSSLSSQPGFIPPERLLDMLKFLNTDSFKNMKFSAFIENQKKVQKQGKTVSQ